MTKTFDIVRFDAGRAFSVAVRYGEVVHLSGHVPLNTAAAPLSTQLEDVLSQIDSVLVRVGSSRKRLLTALVILHDMDDLAEFNRVWFAWLPPGEAPTRTTIEARLANPDWAVEITVTAAGGLET